MCSRSFFFRLTAGTLLVLPYLFVTGCGNSVTVTGQVTYSDNGEPVRAGMVLFSGEKEMGRGTLKDGRYSAGLFKDGDGLPPGTYTVSADSVAIPTMESADMHGNRTTEAPSQQEIYYTKEPKTIEVKKSMTYDFTVERGSRQK